MDYQELLNIDEEALDLEWLDQPKRFMEISEKYADALYEVDEAKKNLDLVSAEIEMKIRKDPGKYDVQEGARGYTEAGYMLALKTNEEYLEAVDDLNKAKHECNILQGAVKSFDQRKVALENLVRLHGQQYFAGPSVPRNISDERQKQKERSERVNKKVKKTMTRKKK